MAANFAHRLGAVAAFGSLAGIAAGILPAHAQSLDQLYANAKDEGAFAFYVGGPTAPWEERAKAFEQLYPGIKISIGGGFSNVLDKKIDQQIAAGKLEVDAAILQTIADFARWKDEGRLLIFKPDGFEAMDGSFKDADGAFWATMVNIVPYMVNTEKVAAADVPNAAPDFLKPQFHGKMVTPYPADDDVTLWVFHHPLGEIRRDNNIAEAPADRPNAAPPGGFGRNSRVHVANGTERFQTADASLVYVLDQAGKLWRGTMDGKDGRLLDQNVSAFQVSDGRLFAQGVDGTLWRAKTDGSERTRIDQTVEAFQPVNAGLIYVLGTDHILWRETGDAGKRAEVDRTVKDFQAIDGNLVFVLGADGTLWREAGTAKSRTLAAGQVTTFQYVPNGDTIYVQTADTLLWRKSANEKAELVDQSVAAFQAVDSHLVFVLGKDGRLWREPGGRDQAVLVDRDVLVNRGQGRIPGGRPGARLPTRQRSSALGRDDAAGAMTEGALVPSSRSGSLTFVSIQPDGALDGIPSGP